MRGYAVAGLRGAWCPRSRALVSKSTAPRMSVLQDLFGCGLPSQPDWASKFCRETSPWPGRRYRGARPEVRSARSYSDASGMVESADSASGALGTVPVAVTEIRPTGAYDCAGSPRAQPAVLPVQGQRRHRASHGVGWHHCVSTLRARLSLVKQGRISTKALRARLSLVKQGRILHQKQCSRR